MNARERLSNDYEQASTDVGDMPDPVTLPANKARQGVPVAGMRVVLWGGIILALAGMAIAYLFLT